MRVLAVRVSHYRDHIMLLRRSQHTSRAFATSIGVVIWQFVNRLVTVFMCLLEQFIEHVVLLRCLLLNFMYKLVHILVLRGQRGIATGQGNQGLRLVEVVLSIILAGGGFA
jgi:hypothetical protein